MTDEPLRPHHELGVGKVQKAFELARRHNTYIIIDTQEPDGDRDE